MIYGIKFMLRDGRKWSSLKKNLTLNVEADGKEEALEKFKKKLLEEGYSLIDDGPSFSHRYIARCIDQKGIDKYVKYVKETFKINPYNEDGEKYKLKFSKQEEILANEGYLQTLVDDYFSGHDSPDSYVEYSAEIRMHVDYSVNSFVEKSYEKWVENLDESTDSGVSLEVKEFDLKLGTFQVDDTGHRE